MTPPQKKQSKKSGAGVVTVETYDSMWTAYCQQQTALHLAATAGVHRDTAAKYIEKGDPKRGLRPLKDRFAEIQAAATKKADEAAVVDLAKARRKSLQITDTAKDLVIKELQKVAQGKKALGNLDRIISAIHKVEADHYGIAGGKPGSGDGGGGGVSRFEAMTDEQLREQLRALAARMGLRVSRAPRSGS